MYDLLAPGAVPESTEDTNDESVTNKHVYDTSPHTARDVNLETEDKVKDSKTEETVYDLMDEPKHDRGGNRVQEPMAQSIRHKENKETDLVYDLMAPTDGEAQRNSSDHLKLNEDQNEGHGDDQSEDKVKTIKVRYKLNKNDKTERKPTDRFNHIFNAKI